MGEGFFRRIFAGGTSNSEKDMGVMGARADRPEMKPEDVRLDDGSPLYHALLDNPEAHTVSGDEAREAQVRLQALIRQAPEVVGSCQGLSVAEARNRLLEAENRDQAKAA